MLYTLELNNSDHNVYPRCQFDRLSALGRVSGVAQYLMAVAILLATTNAMAVAKVPPGVKRTVKTENYHKDPASSESYELGTFPEVVFDYAVVNDQGEPAVEYQDPDMSDVIDIASPFELMPRELESYQLAIVVNISEYQDPTGMQVVPAQTLRVYDADDGLLYFWKVSTGTHSHPTPTGFFRPDMFSSQHWSYTYDYGFMPYSVYFRPTIAIHGIENKTGIRKLGESRASHGCVRLHTTRARELFHLIGRTAEVDGVEDLSVQGNLTGRISRARPVVVIIQ